MADPEIPKTYPKAYPKAADCPKHNLLPTPDYPAIPTLTRSYPILTERVCLPPIFQHPHSVSIPSKQPV